MHQARSAERDGLYRSAVQLAMSSWDHVDGMMQHMRRTEDAEFTSIEAIDMVLRYAPLLLDFRSLDALEALLKKCRRIEKHTTENLADKLAAARALMWNAHRLWDYLELHPEVEEGDLFRFLGDGRKQWQSVVAAWVKMGLLRRTRDGGSWRLALCTRMGRVVRAKCPSCGGTTEGPKAMFLEEVRCPECKARVLCVILTPGSDADAKE